MLPEAHFIHVIRDPRDTAMSWRKTWFAPSQDYATLGSFWRQNVEVGRHAASLAAPLLQEIRFEDLVLRPEAELRRLCSYLSLAYQPAMLDSGARGQERLARLQGRAHVDGRMMRATSARASMSISRGRRWLSASRRGGAK
jgi:hypothetical protein